MELLRRITGWVDKDVEKYKPISLLGIIIPFLPFAFFVHGAPVAEYPVLSGLALTAGVSWGLFVIWRLVRQMVLAAIHDSGSIGRTRYWLTAVGTVLFLVLPATGGWWLSSKIGWPEAYGFQYHGRSSVFQGLSHSPQLLRGGSAYEVELFVLLWFFPVCAVCVLVGFVTLGRRGPR